MKRWVFGLALVGLLGLARPAEASVLDFPVILQVSNVVRCVVTDIGTIASYWVSALTTASTQTLTRVGQCLIYTTGQVTNVGDPDPHTTPVPTPTTEVPHG